MVIVPAGAPITPVFELLGLKVAAARNPQCRGLAPQALFTAGTGHAARGLVGVRRMAGARCVVFVASRRSLRSRHGYFFRACRTAGPALAGHDCGAAYLRGA